MAYCFLERQARLELVTLSLGSKHCFVKSNTYTEKNKRKKSEINLYI